MNEPITNANLGPELIDLDRRHKRWGECTFGPGRKPWNHLRLDAAELAENPKNISEMADIFLLLLDTARMAGFSVTQLVQAACEKQLINEARQWGPVDEHGVSEHINETKTP